MKKIFSILLSVIFIALMLVSCDTGAGSGGDGNKNDPDIKGFDIRVSENIAYVGGEGVRISVSEEAPLGYDKKSMTFKLEGDTGAASITDDGILSFTESGAVTVTGIISGKESSNSITVYGLYPDETIAANLAAELAKPIYLGKKIDIGIKASVSPVYSISGDEGFAAVNPDGSIEFVGIHLAKSRLRLTCGGKTVYEAMYSTDGNGISEEIISSFRMQGIIKSNATDASKSTLSQAMKLSLSCSDIGDSGEYGFLKYFTNLEELEINSMPLFDLSYLDGMKFKALSLRNCEALENTDGGLTLYNTLESLTELESLSLCGSLSCFDRESYDMLISLVRRGDFNIKFIDGEAIGSEKIDDFSKTVFFSYAEYSSHINSSSSQQITPAEEFSHAILCFGSDTASVPNSLFGINASNIEYLELYGDTDRKYKAKISSSSEKLTLNLYNFNIDLSAEVGATVIKTSGDLTLNAPWGSSTIYAGVGEFRRQPGPQHGASGSNSIPRPNYYEISAGSAVYARSIRISTGSNAELTLVGGSGAKGVDGEADGSNTNDASSAKHALAGGAGGYGIYSETTVHIISGRVSVWGGSGGAGGKGGDGSNQNMFSHGFDGGKGGDGGNGGYAIACDFLGSFTYDNDAVYTLRGGAAGTGGKGGNAYALGVDGSSGISGSSGSDIAYHG